MDWSPFYPAYVTSDSNAADASSHSTDTQPGSAINVPCMKQRVEVADIGCGYGGLLIALAPKLPNTLMLGTNPRNANTVAASDYFDRDGD